MGLLNRVQAALGFTRGLNACRSHEKILRGRLPEDQWEAGEAALFLQLVDQLDARGKEPALRKRVIEEKDGCMACFGGDVILNRAVKQVLLASPKASTPG